MSREQRFQRGDVVRVAADLGPSMSHFRADADAIVLGSYKDLYGGNDTDSFSLLWCDTGGQESWFYASQLTLIRHGGEEGIQAVLAERAARESQESDLRWIAANWPTIRTRVPGAAAEELMRRVGIPNPWGSQGEGLAWYANWNQTFAALDPILSAMPADPEIAILGIRLTPIDVRMGE